MPYREIYFSTPSPAAFWQGVGILFAYSNRPFEYGYTMRTLCEVREKGMATPNENDLARDCTELTPLLLQKKCQVISVKDKEIKGTP